MGSIRRNSYPACLIGNRFIRRDFPLVLMLYASWTRYGTSCAFMTCFTGPWGQTNSFVDTADLGGMSQPLFLYSFFHSCQNNYDQDWLAVQNKLTIVIWSLTSVEHTGEFLLCWGIIVLCKRNAIFFFCVLQYNKNQINNKRFVIEIKSNNHCCLVAQIKTNEKFVINLNLTFNRQRYAYFFHTSFYFDRVEHIIFI